MRSRGPISADERHSYAGSYDEEEFGSRTLDLTTGLPVSTCNFDLTS